MNEIDWLDIFPHDIFSSVVLLDGKIISWKVGQHPWESPEKAEISLKHISYLDKMEVIHKKWIASDGEEHSKIFDIYATDWFKNWELHDEFAGFLPW